MEKEDLSSVEVAQIDDSDSIKPYILRVCLGSDFVRTTTVHCSKRHLEEICYGFIEQSHEEALDEIMKEEKRSYKNGPNVSLHCRVNFRIDYVKIYDDTVTFDYHCNEKIFWFEKFMSSSVKLYIKNH